MNEQIGIDFGTTTSAVCRCTYETDRVQGVQEYGLIDKSGKLVTSCQWENALKFQLIEQP